MYSTRDLDAAVAICIAKLAAVGLKPAARVWESSRAFDLAVSVGPKLAVIRCVAQAAPTDYQALATMLADGDFDRAALVYCDTEQPSLSEKIDSWSIADVDNLASSLAGAVP